MNTEHICKELENVNALPISGYGPAIDFIQFDEKRQCWEAGNSEYATPIKFCPFCGIKLLTLEK